jgi:hypothetical protein
MADVKYKFELYIITPEQTDSKGNKIRVCFQRYTFSNNFLIFPSKKSQFFLWKENCCLNQAQLIGE